MQFLDNNLYLFRVWRSFARTSIVREMEFRGNFLIGIVRQFAWLSFFLFFIHTAFLHTNSIAGWQKEEMFILLALSRLFEGIVDLLFTRNLAEFPRSVQQGKFDFNLLKPMPVQFYTSFQRLNVSILGNVLGGIGLLAYALMQLPSLPTVPESLIFILVSFAGITTFYCLLVLTASLVFFLERLESLWSLFMLYTEPLTVPFDVFPGAVRIVLSYLIPIAFIVFVPAQALTNKLSWWQIPVAFGVTIIFFLLSNLVWKAGLRRYSSASS